MALVPTLTTPMITVFVFVFAVIFGVLEMYPVMRRSVRAVIALALALFAISTPTFVSMMSGLLPTLIWVFVIVFLVALIFQLTGLRGRGDRNHEEKIIVDAVILFGLIAISAFVLQQMPEIPIVGSQGLIFIIGLVLIASIFWSAFKIGSGAPPPKQKGEKEG